MTVRFKPHQLKDPLLLVTLLDLDGVSSLPDIGTWLAKSPPENLRSQRRVLLSTLRYMRTHGIEATQSEWTAFAEEISNMPLAWDEAREGKYRYRVPGAQNMSPMALTMFLKATLDKTPPGWHASEQTRQHYRYVLRSLPEGFKRFVPEGPAAEQSLAQSMRSLVGQKFPSPHSSFIETVASKDGPLLASKFGLRNPTAQKTNDLWVQAAFALARQPQNTMLSTAIHAGKWFDPSKSLLPDEGSSMSFFEVLQRLPRTLGRPAWMQEAFIKMVASEKDASLLARGWKAVNLDEDERFALLVGLAKNYPRSQCGRPVAEVLSQNWTRPAEERKALAAKAYSAFGGEQSNTSVNVMLANAKEWIGLLVPEMQPLLDLAGGSGPAQEILQLEQFLQPAETGMLELPTAFDESTEVGNLMPK